MTAPIALGVAILLPNLECSHNLSIFSVFCTHFSILVHSFRTFLCGSSSTVVEMRRWNSLSLLSLSSVPALISSLPSPCVPAPSVLPFLSIHLILPHFTDLFPLPPRFYCILYAKMWLMLSSTFGSAQIKKEVECNAKSLPNFNLRFNSISSLKSMWKNKIHVHRYDETYPYYPLNATGKCTPCQATKTVLKDQRRGQDEWE